MGNLQCHYIVLVFPEIPCSNYTALFFLGHMPGLPRQRAVSFDLESDLKGQDGTGLSEGFVFSWAKCC